MEVKIAKQNDSLSEADVLAVEAPLGIEFPSDYRAFIRKNNGGIPETNEFDVSDAGNSSGVNEFLKAEDVVAKKEAMADRLLEAAYPIAYAEGGNYVCLVLGEKAGIYYWDHELEVEDGTAAGWQNMFFIASTFDEFRASLRKFDPSKVELKPGQVKSAWIDPDFLKSLNS